MKAKESSPTSVLKPTPTLNPVAVADPKGGVLVDAAHFPDTNFRNWIIDNVPGAQDRLLTLPELLAVTTMDITNQSIADLTGIEYFFALGSLDCSNNPLATVLSLNLPAGIQKFIAHDCGLTTLPRLPLSLITLDFSNNAVEDFFKTPENLTFLLANANHLTNVDISETSGLIVSASGDQTVAITLKGNDRQGFQAPANFSSDITFSVGDITYADNTIRSPHTDLTTTEFSSYAHNDAQGNIQLSGTITFTYEYGTPDAGIMVDEAHFPDNSFREWILDNIPGTRNGILTSTEIMDTGSMELAEQSLVNLAGIEYFTSLTYLDCSDNPLSSLPPLPPNLKSLIATNCRLATLPKLPARLSDLRCSKNNLTGFDVFPSTIRRLSCAENHLTYLDLSPIKNLISAEADSQNIMLTLNSNGPFGYQTDASFDPSTSFSQREIFYKDGVLTSFDPSVGSTDFTAPTSYAGPQNVQLSGTLYLTYNPPGGKGNIPVDAAHFPDANFRSWIMSNIPGAANKILTPIAIAATKTIDVPTMHITDLTGIEYFTSLEKLDCSNNSLTMLPVLPDSVKYLNVNKNVISSLPALPTTLTTLSCTNNNLANLPTLPVHLTGLFCDNNQLTKLPVLPPTVQTLSASHNALTSLPSLPEGLINLSVTDNSLTFMLSIPSNIKVLAVSNNSITKLGSLPQALEELYCAHNSLITLPALYAGIKTVQANNNLLASSPLLPESIQNFDIASNQLSSLPYLPQNLMTLNCANNHLVDANLAGLDALVSFTGDKQSATLTLQGNDANGYTDTVVLDSPTFDNPAISYTEGKIKSTSTLAENTQFTTRTNTAQWELSGTLTFKYFDANPPIIYGIPINQATFPDERFRNWVQQNVPGASDGMLSAPDIAAVTRLDPSGQQITDFTGIGYFAYLKKAILSDNLLTELPVLPPSVTDLDVSDNQIASVERIPSALQTLNCANNSLVALPQIPQGLRTLNCSGNNLSSLHALTSQLESLNCSSNKFETLAALPESLATLDCSSNHLTQADFTGLNSLASFKGDNQVSTYTLTGSASTGFRRSIYLDEPTFGNSSISYQPNQQSGQPGVLSSTTKTATATSFAVQIDHSDMSLSGVLQLAYIDLGDPATTDPATSA